MTRHIRDSNDVHSSFRVWTEATAFLYMLAISPLLGSSFMLPTFPSYPKHTQNCRLDTFSIRSLRLILFAEVGH